jgi:hypothetical protein
MASAPAFRRHGVGWTPITKEGTVKLFLAIMIPLFVLAAFAGFIAGMSVLQKTDITAFQEQVAILCLVGSVLALVGAAVAAGAIAVADEVRELHLSVVQGQRPPQLPQVGYPPQG